MLGIVLMVNSWGFMLRLLHALSGSSLFFLVLEQSLVVALNDFGGVVVVLQLMLLGGAACNFVLLGQAVTVCVHEAAKACHTERIVIPPSKICASVCRRLLSLLQK